MPGVVIVVTETPPLAVGSVPDHPPAPPLAEHEVAFVLDQLNVREAPGCTRAGFVPLATKVTVGGGDAVGFTVTFTELGAPAPPGPWHVSV
jgi:hypothetical protein